MNAITLEGVGKSYRIYLHARDRLWEALTGRVRHRQRIALEPLTIDIKHGEVVGLVGVNGAGKSTLLKLIAGTLQASSGHISRKGRVCALLELGTGFHPEMSGLDNIYLGGAVAGQGAHWLKNKIDEIVAFAGLADVIDQPVKTYSSGMLMRLAFSVATAIEPDILILDETLSVGDGTFARKSFERIMGFRRAGKTILFCSHSMYQVQAICTRVLWLDQGQLRMDGDPSEVIAAYTDYMRSMDEPGLGADADTPLNTRVGSIGSKTRLTTLSVKVDGLQDYRLAVESGKSNLEIDVSFDSDIADASPTVAVVIIGANARPVTSASTLIDGVDIARDNLGTGRVRVEFPKLPLLKGAYWVNVFLLCDKGLYVYDKARMVAELVVSQDNLEQGVVSLPHRWCNQGIKNEVPRLA